VGEGEFLRASATLELRRGRKVNPAFPRSEDEAMSALPGHVVRQICAAFLVLSCVAGAALFQLPPAAAAGMGLITGRVSECGPGPIVAPPAPTPTAPPITVKVERADRVVAIEVVKITNAVPRYGTFRFVVPAGTYEVLSSYRSQDRWVKVQAGGHSVVTFSMFACPMLGVKAGSKKAATSAAR
jgi:hypothetical protein